MDIKKALIADAVVLAVYLLAANPSITGLAVHEWVGLGALFVLVTHLAMHWDWVAETLARAVHRRGVRLAKVLLDVLLVLVFMVCCVSGAMVSGAILPALGLYAEGYWLWDPLHMASAKLLLALIIVHVAANWRLVVAGLRRKGIDHDE